MEYRLFVQLRIVLGNYYLPPPAPPVVGYLRGSLSPQIWRAMNSDGKPQLMLLGNAEPTNEDWAAAGVAERIGDTKSITFPQLNGFVLTYAGFMLNRPWAAICEETEDAVKIGFPRSLGMFRNAIARREQ